MPESDLANAGDGAKPESTQTSWLPRCDTRSFTLRVPVELRREPRPLALGSGTTSQAPGRRSWSDCWSSGVRGRALTKNMEGRHGLA